MNANEFSYKISILATVLCWVYAIPVFAAGDRAAELYLSGEYDEALQIYRPDPCVVTDSEPARLYNSANCHYKLDDLDAAIDLYRQVSADTDDSELLARAKYNLGNSHFGKGLGLSGQEPQKAIDEFTKSARYYRQSLDLNAADADAAGNIAIARQIIKELSEQLKQQQPQQGDKQEQQDQDQQDQQNQQQPQQQNGQQDQDQQQNGQQPQDQDQEQSQSDQADGQEDRQNQEGHREEQKSDEQKTNESQDTQEDPQQPDSAQQPGDEQLQEIDIPDTTARDILAKEKQRKQHKRLRIKLDNSSVEKDW